MATVNNANKLHNCGPRGACLSVPEFITKPTNQGDN